MIELKVDDTLYSMKALRRHHDDVKRCKDCSHRLGNDDT